MLSSQIKELNKAKAKVARLESKIARSLASELSSLPARFGFSDGKSFLTAVKAAAGGRIRRAERQAIKGSQRTRAKITAATHAAVKKLAKAGKTGAAIAADLGISVPSVQNIKKALGLVKTRKSTPVVRLQKNAKPAVRRRAKLAKSTATAPATRPIPAAPAAQ